MKQTFRVKKTRVRGNPCYIVQSAFTPSQNPHWGRACECDYDTKEEAEARAAQLRQALG